MSSHSGMVIVDETLLLNIQPWSNHIFKSLPKLKIINKPKIFCLDLSYIKTLKTKYLKQIHIFKFLCKPLFEYSNKYFGVVVT